MEVAGPFDIPMSIHDVVNAITTKRFYKQMAMLFAVLSFTGIITAISCSHMNLITKILTTSSICLIVSGLFSGFAALVDSRFNVSYQDIWHSLGILTCTSFIVLIILSLVGDKSVQYYYIGEENNQQHRACLKAFRNWESDEIIFCSDDYGKVQEAYDKAIKIQLHGK